MHYSKKSDLLNKFKQMEGAVLEFMKNDKSAIVFDLSVFINALGNRKSIKPKTIDEFCHKYVCEEIPKQCSRVDIVTDSNPMALT